MSKIRILLTVLTNTSFILLFLIIIAQGVRIENLEERVDSLQYSHNELKKRNNELEKQIIETEGKCRRIVDTCLDFIIAQEVDKW